MLPINLLNYFKRLFIIKELEEIMAKLDDLKAAADANSAQVKLVVSYLSNVGSLGAADQAQIDALTAQVKADEAALAAALAAAPAEPAPAPAP